MFPISSRALCFQVLDGHLFFNDKLPHSGNARSNEATFTDKSGGRGWNWKCLLLFKSLMGSPCRTNPDKISSHHITDSLPFILIHTDTDLHMSFLLHKLSLQNCPILDLKYIYMKYILLSLKRKLFWEMKHEKAI